MSVVPIVAPIAKGISCVGKPYLLYASEMVVEVADEGGWLTPLEGKDNGDGTWTFKTKSAVFKKQFKFTLTGSFSTPLETETLFTISPADWPVLATVDKKMAKYINRALWDRFGKKTALAGFGRALYLTPTDMPAVPTPVTTAQFVALYYSPQYLYDWPAAFILLISVLAWAAQQTPTADLAALIQFCTNELLHYKSNLYNVNRQFSLMGAKYWEPKDCEDKTDSKSSSDKDDSC